MVNPIIFQIVGFQDSGKTSFIKRFIQRINENHWTVVTIKHHGHGGKPFFDEGKDSYQHLKAGALASVVEGEGHLILQSEMDAWSLEEKISLVSFFRPDIILIEGHKYASYAKGVLIRRKEDVHLLDQLENIKVVYYWDENEQEDFTRFPAFNINDDNGLKWLMEYLQKNIET